MEVPNKVNAPTGSGLSVELHATWWFTSGGFDVHLQLIRVPRDTKL